MHHSKHDHKNCYKNHCQALVCGLILFLVLGGCGRSSKEYSGEVFAMDTLIFISAWGDQGKEAVQEGEQYLYYIEDKFSTTRSFSELSQLNAGAGQWQEMSPEMAQVVAAALALSEETGGAFDPTIYPILRTWGFTQEEYYVPSQAEVRALLPLVGAEQILLNEAGDKIWIPEGVQLDFGGIAKGFAGDQLKAMMLEAGVETGLLTLGGNVVAIGRKSDGGQWTIGIQNPAGGGVLASVAIENQAVVTSGGYQRYFSRDGVLYGHIIDPSTGYPSTSGLASVTIVADSALEGDVLSTALFVMGLEEACAYWQEHQDFQAVFITQEGDIHITKGLEGWFFPVPGYDQGQIQVVSP